MDEPVLHRRLLLAMLLAAVLSAPFPFAGRDTIWWAGLPLWLWWSLGWTVVLSGLTGFAILRHWNDDDD